jgi:hypothetical protein
MPPLPAPVPHGPLGPVGSTGHAGSSTTVSGGGGLVQDLHVLVGALDGDAVGSSVASGSARFGLGSDHPPAAQAQETGARPD